MGIDADCGLAHESAIKEAETDAKKRALMTFGNQFGLALYDRAQTNVARLLRNDVASTTDMRRTTRATPKTVVPAPKHSLRAGGIAERAASNVTPLPKKNCRDIYSRMQDEIDGCSAPDELLAWGSDVADRMRVLPATKANLDASAPPRHRAGRGCSPSCMISRGPITAILGPPSSGRPLSLRTPHCLGRAPINQAGRLGRQTGGRDDASRAGAVVATLTACLSSG
jgi:hypothetical protein